VQPTGRNYEHFGKQTYRSLDISSHINVGGYMFFEKALIQSQVFQMDGG